MDVKDDDAPSPLPGIGARELASFVEEARAGFPGLALSDERFVAHLGTALAALGADAAAAARLAQLRGPELLLACAAGHGEDAALALIEARYFDDARAAVGRMNLGQARADDVLQTVRRRLFVKEGETRPRILEYGGRGALRGWLRVTAVRDALKAIRGVEHEVLVEDERLLDLPSVAEDVELEQMKALYRPMFKAAFAQAFAALTAREKNLLRQQLLDGLSIDDLAVLYRAHRATCARWLEAAREKLLDETRRRLKEEVGIDDGECDSIIRLVQSQLHVSWSRLFDT